MSKKLTTEEFIAKAKKIHGSKYDYSQTEYKGAHSKVCIICLEHGEFWVKANNHLSNKSGCPICGGSKRKSLTELIDRFNLRHNGKYDYSQAEYVNMRTKIKIICKEHGLFEMTPHDHLKGQGCPLCAGRDKTTEMFIEEANQQHGYIYDYSKVAYQSAKEKVCIICPEHGEFWQKPNNHLQGQGCPHCRESKLEQSVRKFLIERNIAFQAQKRFDWLGKQSLDFYLPVYNIAIECQGEQHFKNVAYFGGYKGYCDRMRLDVIKHNKCAENGVKIVYLTNKKELCESAELFQIYNESNVFEEVDELFLFLTDIYSKRKL